MSDFPAMQNAESIISGRLEEEGPFGDPAEQTSNRAELRAVISALRSLSRFWRAEGFTTLVVATDSDYVVQGATCRARNWANNNWQKTSAREGILTDRDLWEVLLGEFEKYKAERLEVQFWHVPRKWNKVANEAAERGALRPPVTKWVDIKTFF